MASDYWSTIAGYDSSYNAYELSEHEYAVHDGRVFYPETDVKLQPNIKCLHYTRTRFSVTVRIDGFTHLLISRCIIQ